MRRAALLAISAAVCCIAIAVAQSTSLFFAPHIDFPVGESPYEIVTADFDKDGNLDLATANNLSHNVSVLLGGGDGTFVPLGPYAADQGPAALATGDLNEDTNPDLVVTNDFGNTVSVLLGNGNGAFQAPRNTVVGTSPEGVVVADFNGDDHLDAACANWLNEPGTVSILIGNGDGTFDPPGTITVEGGPFGIAAGRLDGDADIDLAVTAGDIGMVALLLGNGDGTFAVGPLLEAGVTPQGILVHDLDDDGDADIAVGDLDGEPGQVLLVLLGDGAGNFADAVPYAAGCSPEGLVAADFNDDDIVDLAVADSFGSDVHLDSVSVLIGNGDGTFLAPQSFETNLSPFDVTAGDFDKDGLVDLASANADDDSVSLLINVSDAPPVTPTPTGPTVPVPTTTPTGSPGGCLGDCNNSGDVAVNELVLGVNIALDQAELTVCPPFDRDGSGEVEVSELVGAVNNALGSCP